MDGDRDEAKSGGVDATRPRLPRDEVDALPTDPTEVIRLREVQKKRAGVCSPVATHFSVQPARVQLCPVHVLGRRAATQPSCTLDWKNNGASLPRRRCPGWIGLRRSGWRQHVRSWRQCEETSWHGRSNGRPRCVSQCAPRPGHATLCTRTVSDLALPVHHGCHTHALTQDQESFAKRAPVE